MHIDTETALELWEKAYGTEEWVSDAFGSIMYKYDYGDTDKIRKSPSGSGKFYHYGWQIDHIRPKASFDNPDNADRWNNLEPLHYLNNLRKSDNYPTFTINNNSYRIIRTDDGGYGIIDRNGNRVDWKN